MSLTVTTITANKSYDINGIATGADAYFVEAGDLKIRYVNKSTREQADYEASVIGDFVFDGVPATSISDAVDKGNAIVSFSKAPSGGGAAGALILKGDISLPADFPTIAAVNTDDVFRVTANVIDNDVTKTNTGISFLKGDFIRWTGSTWQIIADSSIFDLQQSIILSGYDIVPNGTTAVDIASGVAVIVDRTTDPNNPDITVVIFEGLIAVTDIFIGITPTTTWGINASGSIVQTGQEPTTEQQRSEAIFALTSHSGAILEIVKNQRTQPLDMHSVTEAIRAITGGTGIVNRGITHTPVVSTRTSSRDVGQMFCFGSNAGLSMSQPDNITIAAESPVNFSQAFNSADAGGTTVISVSDSNATIIGALTGSFSIFDDGTAGSGLDRPVGSLGPNTWAAVQLRINPRVTSMLGVNDADVLIYGQDTFSSSDEAESAIRNGEGNFTLANATVQSSVNAQSIVLGHYIYRGGGSDIANINDAKFIPLFTGLTAGGGVAIQIINNLDSTITDVALAANEGRRLRDIPSVALVDDGSVDLDFSEPTTQSDLLTITQLTALTFSNAKRGQAFELNITGNLGLTFPSEFSQLGSQNYVGTLENSIFIVCKDDTGSAEKFDYRIITRN